MKIQNSLSQKVDLIPYSSQEDTNITIVVPSESTKNLSLSEFTMYTICIIQCNMHIRIVLLFISQLHSNTFTLLI